ncbi:hypothetical protein G6L68_25070 [Agrobacterium fabrum]|uniref:hypothetical protein n=1 Tax=Agrobacterium fabrum TaxID=1176649 RepID=UPI000EF5C15D|nr:hypothetical protein [Agrobacterium fabrum]AYM66158.1 hypothetical protein At12D13_50060 [Agrobacterium fabrum]NTE63905.1 hypothetical protein [Agrobacterium fabrum]
MTERLEIIFDTAERFPGRVSFDISFRNMRYVDHRDAGTPEASKIAHDFRATAERAGFRYVRGNDDEIRRFVSAFPDAAADPRSVVDRFRDQGYDVAVRGAYKAGRILTWAELSAMSYGEHRQADRDEAAYAAGRAAERAGRDAASVLRLQAAALADDAPETVQLLQSMKDAVRVRQAALREQEIGLEVPEERQDRAFAA